LSKDRNLWITGKGWIWQVYFDEDAIQDTHTVELLHRWSGSYADYNRQFLLLEFWNRVRNVSRRAVEGLFSTRLCRSGSTFTQSRAHRANGEHLAFRSVIERSVNLFQLGTIHYQIIRYLGNSSSKLFRFLVEENAETSGQLCVLIDGLDEFSGDLSGLIAWYQRLASYPPKLVKAVNEEHIIDRSFRILFYKESEAWMSCSQDSGMILVMKLCELK